MINIPTILPENIRPGTDDFELRLGQLTEQFTAQQKHALLDIILVLSKHTEEDEPSVVVVTDRKFNRLTRAFEEATNILLAVRELANGLVQETGEIQREHIMVQLKSIVNQASHGGCLIDMAREAVGCYTFKDEAEGWFLP